MTVDASRRAASLYGVPMKHISLITVKLTREQLRSTILMYIFIAGVSELRAHPDHALLQDHASRRRTTILRLDRRLLE